MPEFELYRGTPHPLNFEGVRDPVEDTDGLAGPPRAEVRGEKIPASYANLEFEGVNLPIPVYEISLGPVDRQSARAIGGLAANQLVVMSRIAERGAALAGVDHSFAHPAYMSRGAGGTTARYAAIPQPVNSNGSAGDIEQQRDIASAGRLWNFLPEDMTLQYSNRQLPVERPRGRRWIDVDYDYEVIGRSQEGVTVAKSTVREVESVPLGVPADALLLTHTEAIIEAARTGVHPALVARMVFATGVRRDEKGQQRNIFTGLGYFSRRTLDDYLRGVKF